MLLCPTIYGLTSDETMLANAIDMIEDSIGKLTQDKCSTLIGGKVPMRRRWYKISGLFFPLGRHSPI